MLTLQREDDIILFLLLAEEAFPDATTGNTFSDAPLKLYIVTRTTSFLLDGRRFQT